MKIASVADVKAHLSAYLKASAQGPVVVTRNGKAVAVLVAVGDDEDLERFAGSRDALAARRMNAAFRDLLAFEVARTRTLFERGLPLADMVGRRLRHEVRIFARGGLAILARIESVGYDVFRRRPTLGRAELLRLVVRGLWR